MAHAASQLPPELLLHCLRAADPPTRVRASHISRTWRELALSEGRLWDSFSCSKFRDTRHQNAMFDQLQAMLLRSHSLPFRLRIPHRYHGTVAQYRLRLIGLAQLDIRRLASYDGPGEVFCGLIPDQTPLPTLISLKLLEPDVEWVSATIALSGVVSGRSIPNLQTLEAHFITFSPESSPFLALQSLTCSIDDDDDLVELFKVFPNVVQLKINDMDPATQFPPVSVPASLRTIALRPLLGKKVYLSWILRNLEGARIPRLVAHEAGSIRGILPLFLTTHPCSVELRLDSSGKIVFAALPDGAAAEFTWSIFPCRKSNSTFINGLETHSCERLTSISVGLEQLGSLFAAKLHVDGLKRLEFRLDGAQVSPLLRAHDASFTICAPRLQHVVFSTGGRAVAIRTRMDEIQSVLVVLYESFRSLIVYDGDLLDSITLSGPAACAKLSGCAGFARFAKEYRVCTMG